MSTTASPGGSGPASDTDHVAVRFSVGGTPTGHQPVLALLPTEPLVAAMAANPLFGQPASPAQSGAAPVVTTTEPVSGVTAAPAAYSQHVYPVYKKLPTQIVTFSGHGDLLKPDKWTNWKLGFESMLKLRKIIDPEDQWVALGSYLAEAPLVAYQRQTNEPGYEPAVGDVKAFLLRMEQEYLQIDVKTWLNTQLSTVTMQRDSVHSFATKLKDLNSMLLAYDGAVELKVLHKFFYSGLPQHLRTEYTNLADRFRVERQIDIDTLPLSGYLPTLLQAKEEEVKTQARNDAQRHQAALNAINVGLNAMSTHQRGRSLKDKNMAKFNLSSAEHDRRQRASLCYKCGNPGHRAPSCSSPNGNSQ